MIRAAPGAFAASPTILAADSPSRVPNQYIVVFKSQPTARTPEAVQDLTASLLAAYPKAKLMHSYSHVLQGFAAHMSQAVAETLASNPNVAWVEADQIIHTGSVQSNPPWGLDRVDQRATYLDDLYHYSTTGNGVDVYIVDSGLTYSNDFASRVGNGVDEVGDGHSTSNGIESCPSPSPSDSSGHGTHVAGTAGGTTYGIAKGVTLHSVRVIDCHDSGYSSWVVSGLEWIETHKNPLHEQVVNMSIWGSYSQSEDTAVDNFVNNESIPVVVIAGNAGSDACNYSPAAASEAITVAATDDTDTRPSFSNYGSCVDLFAPGVGITSDWDTGPNSTNTLNGTSMAAPHVTGEAALYLESHTSATASDVAAYISAWSTHRAVLNNGAYSPDTLAYTLNVPDAPLPGWQKIACSPFPEYQISWNGWGETGNSGPTYTLQINNGVNWVTMYTGSNSSYIFEPGGNNTYQFRVNTTIDGITGAWDSFGFKVFCP